VAEAIKGMMLSEFTRQYAGHFELLLAKEGLFTDAGKMNASAQA